MLKRKHIITFLNYGQSLVCQSNSVLLWGGGVIWVRALGWTITCDCCNRKPFNWELSLFCQQQKLSVCEVSWVYVSYDCQPCIVNQILNTTFSFCSKPCHHLNFTLSIATTMMSHDNISNYGVTNGDHQHLMGCVLCISIFKPHLKLPSRWEKETTITITIASNNNKLHSLCPKTDEGPVSLITDGGLPYQLESPSTKL